MNNKLKVSSNIFRQINIGVKTNWIFVQRIQRRNKHEISVPSFISWNATKSTNSKILSYGLSPVIFYKIMKSFQKYWKRQVRFGEITLAWQIHDKD